MLYSARGSQSAGIGEYYRSRLNLEVNDPDSTFLLDVHSQKWGNRFFELRPAFSLSAFMDHHLRSVLQQVDHDILVSLPLYSKIAGISLNEIEIEQYNIKLKPEYNNKDFIHGFQHHYLEKVNQHTKQQPAEDTKFMNIFPVYAWKQGAEEDFERKAAAMDQIFNVITLVSMGLCFFSLSSTMTANIYD